MKQNRVGKFTHPIEPIDHLSMCPGDKLCPRCGRRMCQNCTTHDGERTYSHAPGHEGECVICSEMYKETEIILYPDARKVKEVQEKLKFEQSQLRKKPRRMIQT